MKFRIGDLCEIVRAPRAPETLGHECTIIEIGSHGQQPGDDCIIECPSCPSGHFSGQWSSKFSHLRLKRPPSWDSWLFDTSDISREKREEIQA